VAARFSPQSSFPDDLFTLTVIHKFLTPVLTPAYVTTRGRLVDFSPEPHTTLNGVSLLPFTMPSTSHPNVPFRRILAYPTQSLLPAPTLKAPSAERTFRPPLKNYTPTPSRRRLSPPTPIPLPPLHPRPRITRLAPASRDSLEPAVPVRNRIADLPVIGIVPSEKFL